MASTATAQEITLRPAEPADTDELARIVYEAFGDIHDHHRFQRDFPAIEAAAGMMGAWIPHPAVWGVVAEADGKIVGSNFLDERDPIRGVGPITIDPKAQNVGVGRRLMEAVVDRGKQAPGIRLLQDGFHMRSLSLYTRLGFDTKAPCIVMQGEPRGAPADGVEVRPDDAEACARIVFEAFGAIHDHHRFPRDFPVLEAAIGMMSMWIPHPAVWGVVAERDGRVVGSNFLDERDPIAGVGPITVDPEGQNAGVGRRLMEEVLERGKDAPGIRLAQDGFHMRSLSLYASLGFDVTAACVLVSGMPQGPYAGGVEARPLTEDDVDECEQLCKAVHGFERTGALRDALQAFAPFVGVRDNRIVAYASTLTFWPMAYGVAESTEDMTGLVHSAAALLEEPLSMLVPLRSGLFRWSLEQKMRAVKPMNVMSRGEYQEPRGSWFPSVIY